MDRYAFEVLRFLAEEKPAVSDRRALAGRLRLSGRAVDLTLCRLKEEGRVEMDGQGCAAITEAGLAALEPFRVRRAVILAAGFGSRMMPATVDRPKPLVTVRGVRILDTLLDALLAAGVTDITVVRGYRGERFDELLEKYPALRFADNPDYERTNNISSAMAALDQIDACYLCEADLVVSNPRILHRYQIASSILGSWSAETDDWCYDVRDGDIVNYRKGGRWCWNYYGISFWTAEDSARLRADFRDVWENEPGGRDVFWEFVPLVLRRENYHVELCPCSREDILEIDSFGELCELDPSYTNPEDKESCL